MEHFVRQMEPSYYKTTFRSPFLSDVSTCRIERLDPFDYQVEVSSTFVSDIHFRQVKTAKMNIPTVESHWSESFVSKSLARRLRLLKGPGNVFPQAVSDTNMPPSRHAQYEQEWFFDSFSMIMSTIRKTFATWD